MRLHLASETQGLAAGTPMGQPVRRLCALRGVTLECNTQRVLALTSSGEGESRHHSIPITLVWDGASHFFLNVSMTSPAVLRSRILLTHGCRYDVPTSWRASVMQQTFSGKVWITLDAKDPGVGLSVRETWLAFSEVHWTANDAERRDECMYTSKRHPFYSLSQGERSVRLRFDVPGLRSSPIPEGSTLESLSKALLSDPCSVDYLSFGNASAQIRHPAPRRHRGPWGSRNQSQVAPTYLETVLLCLLQSSLKCQQAHEINSIAFAP